MKFLLESRYKKRPAISRWSFLCQDLISTHWQQGASTTGATTVFVVVVVVVVQTVAAGLQQVLQALRASRRS